MLNYFTDLTNFKHFGSSTCSHVHNQSHDTYGQHKSGGLNLNLWTCWRSKVFEICQMLLLLFCLNKDQLLFLLMLRTSSAEVRQKNVAGKCKLLSPQDSYRGRYLPYLELCGNVFLWMVSVGLGEGGRDKPGMPDGAGQGGLNGFNNVNWWTTFIHFTNCRVCVPNTIFKMK